MESSFLKYFEKHENSNKCKCLIIGCKTQVLTFIKGNLKRHSIDSNPSVANKMNLNFKRREILTKSSINEFTPALKKSRINNNDIVNVN